jgi:uncharacterized metal-binding protein YceD (DUF177 family)
MRKLGEYDIPFTGLVLGTHRFQFEVDSSFFDKFEYSEIEKANYKVELDLEKKSTMLILHFNLKGKVKTICDSCGDDFEMNVSHKDRIIVKFGEDTGEAIDEIWEISQHDHQINIANLIYEFAHLSLPSKRVHPKGKCNEKALEELENLEQNQIEVIDPRWEGLKSIKKDLK